MKEESVDENFTDAYDVSFVVNDGFVDFIDHSFLGNHSSDFIDITSDHFARVHLVVDCKPFGLMDSVVDVIGYSYYCQSSNVYPSFKAPMVVPLLINNEGRVF